MVVGVTVVVGVCVGVKDIVGVTVVVLTAVGMVAQKVVLLVAR